MKELILLAQAQTQTSFDLRDIENPALVNNLGGASRSGMALAAYIQSFWEAAFILSGLAFTAYLLLGGFRYLTAGGDQKMTTEAKNIITHAIIGLAIIAGSYIIVRIVESIFGINIISNTILFKGPNPSPDPVP